MRKTTERIISADKVNYQREAAEFYMDGISCLTLFYREVILIGIECHDGEKQYELRVEDIGEKTRGFLIVANIKRELLKINIEKTGRTAGELLLTLAGYCPWAWVGTHEWLENRSIESWQDLFAYYSINRL